MITKIMSIVTAILLGAVALLRLKNTSLNNKLETTKSRLDAQNALNAAYKKIDQHTHELNQKHRAEKITEADKLKAGDRDQLNDTW